MADPCWMEYFHLSPVTGFDLRFSKFRTIRVKLLLSQFLDLIINEKPFFENEYFWGELYVIKKSFYPKICSDILSMKNIIRSPC